MLWTTASTSAAPLSAIRRPSAAPISSIVGRGSPAAGTEQLLNQITSRPVARSFSSNWPNVSRLTRFSHGRS